MGRMFRVLYIVTLLTMRMASEMEANRAVNPKKVLFPRRNQALLEKGMLTSRNRTENSAANVTVPSSW